MSGRVDAVLEVLRRVIVEPIGRLGIALGAAAVAIGAAISRYRWRLAILVVVALCAHALYKHPPIATAPGGEVLVRTNLLDGSVHSYSAGTVLAIPGVHQVRFFSTRDQVYRLTEGASAITIRIASRQR